MLTLDINKCPTKIRASIVYPETDRGMIDDAWGCACIQNAPILLMQGNRCVGVFRVTNCTYFDHGAEAVKVELDATMIYTPNDDIEALVGAQGEEANVGA